MDKELRIADLDDLLPEIESNEVVLVADGDGGAEERAALEELTRKLEAELADTRGELGARIAELEGEVEALRETEADHLREIEELQARQPEGGGSNSTLISMLHAELNAAHASREQLAAELADVRADRERLQDELAAQIADLAGQLAQREAELAAAKRHGGTGPDASALTTRVEELEAENEFLQAEIDRLAAQIAGSKR